MNFSLNVWYNLVMKPPGPGYFFAGRFWILDSVSLFIIGPLRFVVPHYSVLIGGMFLFL